MNRRNVIQSFSSRAVEIPAEISEQNHCGQIDVIGNHENTYVWDDENIRSFNEDFHLTEESRPQVMHFITNSQESVQASMSTFENENDVFINELRKIAYSNNATQQTIEQIMNLIRPKYPFLPLSARTLLGTPKKREIIQLDTGKMVYFGVEAALVRKLQFETNSVSQEVTNISIDLNIDGLPLFKSSKTEFWPILAKSTSLNDKSPFAVAIFCGTGKPQPLDLYLENLIDEIMTLKERGFMYNNQCYRVEIRCVSCDAPARALLKSISSHTSFHGCERCKHRAVKVNYQLFYPVTTEVFGKRKNAHFTSGKSSKHIKEHKSPLLALGIGLVSQFVLDPMHLIYFGVVKRLIKKYWLAGNRKFQLSKSAVRSIVDERSQELRHYIPNQFGRKCQGFSEVERWKATEFRLFILY